MCSSTCYVQVNSGCDFYTKILDKYELIIPISDREDYPPVLYVFSQSQCTTILPITRNVRGLVCKTYCLMFSRGVLGIYILRFSRNPKMLQFCFKMPFLLENLSELVYHQGNRSNYVNLVFILIYLIL